MKNIRSYPQATRSQCLDCPAEFVRDDLHEISAWKRSISCLPTHSSPAMHNGAVPEGTTPLQVTSTVLGAEPLAPRAITDP